MADIRIEFDRGDGSGWQTRQEGEAELTADQLAAGLPRYCSQYPHRAYHDGKLVAEVTQPRYLRSKVVRT